jgi:hypothetical protein
MAILVAPFLEFLLMKWILLILVAILLMGPFRGLLVRHARFLGLLVSTALGALAGLFLAGLFLARTHLAPVESFAVTVVMTVGTAKIVGESVKAWYDRNVGRSHHD